MPNSPQSPGRVPLPFMQTLHHNPNSHIHSVPTTILSSFLRFISFTFLICNALLLHFSCTLYCCCTSPASLTTFYRSTPLLLQTAHFYIAIHLPAFLPPLPTHSILCGTPSHTELDSPRLKLVTCTFTPHCQTGKCITPPNTTTPIIYFFHSRTLIPQQLMLVLL